MATKTLQKPQTPHERHTFVGGEVCAISCEQENGEWTISCKPKLAHAPVWGFGRTKQEALDDLEKFYQELIDFSTHD